MPHSAFWDSNCISGASGNGALLSMLGLIMDIWETISEGPVVQIRCIARTSVTLSDESLMHDGLKSASPVYPCLTKPIMPPLKPRFSHRYEEYPEAFDSNCRVSCLGTEVGFFVHQSRGVDFVFVDHPSYPRPGGIYADVHGAYGDNQVGMGEEACS